MTSFFSSQEGQSPGRQPYSGSRLSLQLISATLLMFFAPVMASAGQALIQDNGDGTGATVGMVDVSYDGENIAVKFTTEEPYRLLEAHAAAAAECADIPQNKKGNPKVGRFELGWNSPDLAGETEKELAPLEATSYTPGDVICIAAHAVVYNAEGGETVEEAIENTVESAWADGDLFGGKSWATHFLFTIPELNPSCPCWEESELSVAQGTEGCAFSSYPDYAGLDIEGDPAFVSYTAGWPWGGAPANSPQVGCYKEVDETSIIKTITPAQAGVCIDQIAKRCDELGEPLVRKTVFVTSMKFDGDLAVAANKLPDSSYTFAGPEVPGEGLRAGDYICNYLAADAGLGGTYTAWLSDDFTSARERTTDSTAPYYRTDGTRVADNRAAIIDGVNGGDFVLDAPISIDEWGGDHSSEDANVWTGTSFSGETAPNQNCFNWLSPGMGSPSGAYGSTFYSGANTIGITTRWTQRLTTMECHVERRLYCFQD